jgi:hypothetical protein
MRCNFNSLLVLLSLVATWSLLGCGDDSSSDTDETTDSTTDSGDDTETVTDTDTVTVTDTESIDDTASQLDSEALGQFGEPCEVNEDCDQGVCHEFGQVGFVCTIECEEAADCPEGSEGQKCNQQGVCRP